MPAPRRREDGGQGLLGIIGGEERRAALLDRRGRVVVEDGVGEIGRVGALAHAAEQRSTVARGASPGRCRNGTGSPSGRGRRRRSRLSWTCMTLAPAAVLSPCDDEAVGHDDARGDRARDGLARWCRSWSTGIVLGRSAATYWTVVVGPFWPTSRSTSRPALLVASIAVAELVLDVRAELDRVGAAELLLREADRERGGDHLRSPLTVVSVEATGVTVTVGVMFSDQESSVAATPVAGVGDLERARCRRRSGPPGW